MLTVAPSSRTKSTDRLDTLALVTAHSIVTGSVALELAVENAVRSASDSGRVQATPLSLRRLRGRFPTPDCGAPPPSRAALRSALATLRGPMRTPGSRCSRRVVSPAFSFIRKGLIGSFLRRSSLVRGVIAFLLPVVVLSWVLFRVNLFTG